MEAEATGHFPNESGGILLGYTIKGGVAITRASDAGPGAHHAPGEFRRDGEHAQRLRDDMVRDTAGAIDYIGEWHSHPLDIDASGKDRRSMYAISTDTDYAMSDPVLVVLRRGGPDRWAVAAHQVVDGRLQRLRVKVVQTMGRPASIAD